MSYEIVFTDEAIEDLAFLSIYEIQFTFSAEQAQDRIVHSKADFTRIHFGN